MPPDKTYFIKPLEWERRRARTVGGWLEISHEPGGRSWFVWFRLDRNLGTDLAGISDTQRAAKSAAESWHRERLLPALGEVGK